MTVHQQLQRIGNEIVLTTPKAEKVPTIAVPNLVAESEPAAPVQRLSSIVNGSIKHLLLSYRTADACVRRSRRPGG